MLGIGRTASSNLRMRRWWWHIQRILSTSRVSIWTKGTLLSSYSLFDYWTKPGWRPFVVFNSVIDWGSDCWIDKRIFFSKRPVTNEGIFFFYERSVAEKEIDFSIRSKGTDEEILFSIRSDIDDEIFFCERCFARRSSSPKDIKEQKEGLSPSLTECTYTTIYIYYNLAWHISRNRCCRRTL